MYSTFQEFIYIFCDTQYICVYNSSGSLKRTAYPNYPKNICEALEMAKHFFNITDIYFLIKVALLSQITQWKCQFSWSQTALN